MDPNQPNLGTPDPLGAKAGTQQTQVGAGAGGAGAGATAQQAAAQTGAAQAGAGSAGQAAQTEITADIGKGEAYLINMKRLVENALNVDAHLQQILLAQAQRLARNAEDFDTQVRQIALNNLQLGALALQNAVNLANQTNQEGASDAAIAKDNVLSHGKALDTITESERERTIRGGDAGDVLRWQAVATMDTITDTIVAKLLAKMAAAGKV